MPDKIKVLRIKYTEVMVPVDAIEAVIPDDTEDITVSPHKEIISKIVDIIQMQQDIQDEIVINFEINPETPN